MAITEAFAGTATIGLVEYSLVTNSTTLGSNTGGGVYQVIVDFSTLLNGDEYLVDIKEKVISTGAQKLIHFSYIDGKTDDPLVFPSLILMHGWDVTVQKVLGTDRAISWSIRKVG